MTISIFVPGIKGTELYEGKNKRWFPATRKDLKSLNIENKLQAEKVLTSVNALFFIHIDLYQGVIDKFIDDDKFIPYPYDWRQSVLDIVDDFVDFILETADSSNEDIILVAHSMGGILSKLAILKIQEKGRIDVIKKLITIGTPWKGSPEAYKVLEYGEPGIYSNLSQVLPLFNDKDTRSLARQLPSTYQLLPSEEYFNEPYGNFIISASKDSITYDDVKSKVQQMYNEENKKSEEESVIDVWKEYILPIHNAMKADMPVEHDCLIGIDHPTFYTFPEKSYSFMRMYKSPSLIRNGDGVVPFISALPHHEANVYNVTSLHREQCSNSDVVNFIEWSLNDKEGARPVGIGELDVHAGEDRWLIENTKLKNGIMARIMCPVETTIVDKDQNYIAGVIDPSLSSYNPLVKTNDIQYLQIGDAKYLYYTGEEELNFEINAYKEGIAEVAVEVFDEDEAEIQFSTIPITPTKKAKLSIRNEKTVEELPKVELEFDNQQLEPKVKKKRDPEEIEATPLPELELKIEKLDDTLKTYRVPVYSGPVALIVDTEDQNLIDELLYSVNGKRITPIKGNSAVIDLPSGEYKIEVFGKDIYGRTLNSKEKIIKFDKNIPSTQLELKLTPDYSSVNFNVETFGAKYKTYYRFVDYDKLNENRSQKEWEYQEDNHEEIFIPYEMIRALALDRNKKFVVEYFSVNEFGLTEPVKAFVFAIRDLKTIMWGEVASLLTAKAIFKNVTGDTNSIDDEKELKVEQKIQKKYSVLNPEVGIGDNVQSVLFTAPDYKVEVFYSEKYALYFVDAPTEVLEIGQECTFSFELIAERTEESIITTDPQARLKPIRPGGHGKVERIPLKLKDGVFTGSFVVGELFKKYKHKLIITDIKNVTPPLRETAIMLREEEK
ncbi:lipase/acyltransferase domain-containing protein [Bacillus paranthracis]|uniref:lipase/acyltransferase domain-containing protein n=1 Tax=Bacillus paranthracis TaxID=2026186 RepID=UPI0021CF54D3|nr:hypothetical protein [Bacillus paranthracis]MCU5203394.1 hypothetical protein [Bacillus paranthracis]